MRKLLLALLLVALLTVKVECSELLKQQAAQFGLDEIQKELPSAADPYLNELPTEPQDLFDGASEILSGTIAGSGSYLRASVSLMMRTLLILLLCRLAESNRQNLTGRAVTMSGVLALTLCAAGDLRTMIGLGRSTIEEMVDFSTLLLPVMASAATASGATVGAGAAYGLAVLFARILIGFCGNVLIPMIYAYLALGVADAALGETRLTKLRELLAWVVKWCLKAVVYIFTGFMAISGLLSGSVDKAALKATKVTLSGVVPVVGGIISDAAETVLYSAGVLKGVVGTFGMLAILAVFAMPFLRTGLHYLVLKLTAALGGVMGSSLCGYMQCIAETMGFLLAMLGSCVFMCLISCCCLMMVSGL